MTDAQGTDAYVVEKTFYRWREKYAGVEAGEAKRLRELEDQNARLKKLLAEQLLHNEALKDALSKNGEARRAASSGSLHSASVRAE